MDYTDRNIRDSITSSSECNCWFLITNSTKTANIYWDAILNRLKGHVGYRSHLDRPKFEGQFMQKYRDTVNRRPNARWTLGVRRVGSHLKRAPRGWPGRTSPRHALIYNNTKQSNHIRYLGRFMSSSVAHEKGSRVWIVSESKGQWIRSESLFARSSEL